MRTEIRESQVNTTRRQLPNRVVLDTPELQTTIIVGLTEDMIKPNAFPDLNSDRRGTAFGDGKSEACHASNCQK